jgi:hypothetical protein
MTFPRGEKKGNKIKKKKKNPPAISLKGAGWKVLCFKTEMKYTHVVTVVHLRNHFFSFLFCYLYF